MQMLMKTASIRLLSIFCAQPFTVMANVFLSKDTSNNFGVANLDEVNGILFEEITGFFGRGSGTGDRVAEVEILLESLFKSLPKDHHGGLGHATARYALHRYFEQQHAWHIKGLAPTGDAWNASSPTDILTDQVPSYIQVLIEETLSEKGFCLHQLALMAATIEHVVQTETVMRVEAAYLAAERPTFAVLSGDHVDDILDFQQVIYLLSLPYNNLTKVRLASKRMNKIYPGWQDTQMFVRDTRENLAYAERDRRNPFTAKQVDFREMVHLVEEVSDQFGHFQDLECRATKDTLLEREFKSSGRLRLVDFYGLALAGDPRFAESEHYLRELGALDDSDPQDPRVIIPNYLYGMNNCFESSSYYSVCCLDECNVLLTSLERTFAAPEAGPVEVAFAVAQLSSSTVAAPRNLSNGLLDRLHNIAKLHGGMVPLHGKQFALFLHHAFPRECPLPHLSGTISPRSPQQYRKEEGVGVAASKHVIKEVGGRANRSQLSTVENVEDAMYAELEGPTDSLGESEHELVWTLDAEEELLVYRTNDMTVGRSWVRVVAMFAAMAVVVSGLWQKYQEARLCLGLGCDKLDENKHYV